MLPRFFGTCTKFEPGYSLGSVFKQNLSHRVGSDLINDMANTWNLTLSHGRRHFYLSVQAISIWYLTWSFVIVRSMYVGGICRILWYPFTWKLFIFFWSVRFNCIVSNPYIILLLTMEWKTWTFHLIDVRVLFQNNLSLLHVRVQSVVGFMISLWLSTVSVSNVSKYTADPFRGTSVPSRYLMDDVLGWGWGSRICLSSVPY